MGIRQVAATARYIDGKEHVVTVEEVGLANANSVAASFRQACISRGWVSEAVITGSVIKLKAIPYSEANCGMRIDKRDRVNPTARHTFATATLAYLQTTPGTAQARELSGLLVQLSRAAQ